MAECNAECIADGACIRFVVRGGAEYLEVECVMLEERGFAWRRSRVCYLCPAV